MAEQKSLLSTVIGSVKEVVTNAAETVKDYITVPAADKPENPIVVQTNKESGYEKYYTGAQVVADLERESRERNIDVNRLAERGTSGDLSGTLSSALPKDVNIPAVIESTNEPPVQTTNERKDERQEKRDESVQANLNVQPNLQPVKIEHWPLPEVGVREIKDPVIEKQETINKEKIAEENLKTLDRDSQREIVNRSLQRCHQILKDLSTSKESLGKIAISQKTQGQFLLYRQDLDENLNQAQTFVDKLVPLQSRLLSSNPYASDKYDLETIELQIDHLASEVKKLLQDIEDSRKEPKSPPPRPTNINIKESQPEKLFKPESKIEEQLLEKEQNVIQAENIVLNQDEQTMNRSTEPPLEELLSKQEEPKIPYFDEKAPYNLDLKQKAVELGYEVEKEKDLDEVIKELQEQS